MTSTSHTDHPAGLDGTAYLQASKGELTARHAATKLRNALRMNAEFSLLTGLIATAGASPVADFLGLSQTWLVLLVGISLLGFAIGLFLVAGQRTSFVRSEALLVTGADIGWVIGTAVVIAGGWLSTEGSVLIAVLAVPVLTFAVLQWRAGRLLKKAIAETPGTAEAIDEFPPVEIVRSQSSLPIEVDALWPVMTDHALYAKLALNLKGATVLAPNGPGLRRSCTDTRGGSWSEVCTLWEPGRRYDVAVETRAEDYPYPLETLHGSWAVSERPGPTPGSDILMQFAVQPRRGLAGRMFVPLLHVSFGPVLKRIVRGWSKAAENGEMHNSAGDLMATRSTD